MKDVSKILAKRLKMLEQPFSRDWLSDFSFFMEFVQTNPLTNQIIASFENEKEVAHGSLIHNLEALFKDGKGCLQEIQRQINDPKALGLLQPQIQSLLKAKIDRKRIADPMFKFETTYLDYIAGLSRLLEDISKSDASPLVKNYATIGPNLDINLSFSPFMRFCNHMSKLFLDLEPRQFGVSGICCYSGQSGQKMVSLSVIMHLRKTYLGCLKI